MKNPSQHISLLAALLCLGLAPAATATVVVLPDDETLADRAAAVVLAEVAAVVPLGDRAATDLVLADVETLAGTAVGEAAIVRLPGGVDAQGRGLVIAGLRPPLAGDRLLLFLDRGEAGTYRPIELMLGMFRVEDHGNGPVAHRELGGVRLLPRADGRGTADAPRDVSAWRAWLGDRDRGIVRSKDYFVAAPAAALPDKFRIAASSALPAPLGCGTDGGHPIRWSRFDSGATADFARGGSPITGLVAGGAEAFTAALAAWSDGDGSSVLLADGGTTAANGGLLVPDGISTLLTGDPSDSIPGRFEGVGLLALGGAWLDCDQTVLWGGTEVHPVVEADIVTQDGIELFFAASADPEAAAAELFAHELGHALGFAHSDDPDALMFGLIHDDGRGALLGDDERAARALLYPPVVPGGPHPGTPPPPPTAVVALLAEDHVAMAWRLARSGAAVLIERRTGDGPYALLTSVGNVESYFDRALLPGTTYSYRLTAFDQAGSSPPSAEVSVTTDGTIAPPAPSNLRSAPMSPTAARLSWQDNASDELFYRVESRLGGIWQPLPQTLAANTTEVLVDGLEHGLVYRMRVRAVGLLAASSPSNPAAVHTLPPGTGCTQQAQRLCLLDGRFNVTVRFRNPRLGNAVDLATSVAETDNTGRFWFFRESNTELIVKMIDARTANGFAWIFYGGLSDLEYWIDVTDTETAATRTYYNPAGAQCGRADTQAFPLAGSPPTGSPPTGSPPAGSPPRQPPLGDPPQGVTMPPLKPAPRAAEPTTPPARNTSNGGPCVRDDQTLCLLDGRFAVTVDFLNQHAGGEAGVGKAIDGGDQTGFFYFFNLRNTELVVKMLDGRTANDHFWLFYGGLSDVQFEITVTDTETGAVRTFLNQPGEICGGKDTQLFFEPPAPEPPGGGGPIPL